MTIKIITNGSPMYINYSNVTFIERRVYDGNGKVFIRINMLDGHIDLNWSETHLELFMTFIENALTNPESGVLPTYELRELSLSVAL